MPNVNSVLFNVSQDFPESSATGASKARARANIGAASAASLDAETARAQAAEGAARTEVVQGDGIRVERGQGASGQNVYTISNNGQGVFKRVQAPVNQSFNAHACITGFTQDAQGVGQVAVGYLEDATQSASGLMSTADKTKLDGIAAGAEVNQNAFSNVKVGSTTVQADSKTDTLELAAGTNIAITTDTANDKITIAATDTTYTAGTGLTLSGTQFSVTNPFTTADKTKLDGIATGAEVNQNSFSNVKVGSTTIAADSKTDTLEIAAGSNITLTPDASGDKVTIAATDTTYTAGNGLTLSSGQFSVTNPFTTTDKTKLDGLVGVYTVTYGDTTANLFSTLTTKYNAGTEILLRWSSGTGHVDYAYLADKTDTQFLFKAQWPFDDGNLGRIWLFTLSSAGAWTSTSEWPAKATEANSVAWTGVTGKPSNIVSDANYVHTDNNFTTTLKDKLDNLKGVYMVTYGDTTSGLFDTLMGLVNGGTEVILRWSSGTDKVNYAFLADIIDNVQLMFIATWPYNDGTFGHGEIFTLGRVGGWSHTSRNVANAANAAGDNAGHTIATYYMPRENIRILGFTGAPANMGTTGVTIMEGHFIKVDNGGQAMANISVNNNSTARATLKFYLRYVTTNTTVYGADRSIYVAAGGSSSVCLNIDVVNDGVQSLIAMCEWRDAGSASTTNPGLSFSTNLLVVGDNITVN